MFGVGPASAGEVEEAWSDKALDPQAVDLDAQSREQLPYNATDDGEWGLKIGSPDVSSLDLSGRLFSG